ncbi:MAG: indolepyruvate ferredoxin oxidoreductase family protein [Solirubrobacterales bacterium]|nr:indolepyruvate ferredoxin oxidoreductase family protein [Solirubrobacterales bacterium]
MSIAELAHPQTTLEDKYTAESGQILINGIQALVRLTLDQRRLDAGRGYDTGVYVSGYQGSPLAGLDREFQRAQRHLAPADVVFQPAVNEELAATAVGGTQLLHQLAGARKEGVTGFWYGKNPGFDRAADAIRHANLSGTQPLGGVVALIGDDPTSKSSTVPSSCEPICRSLVMPLLAPADVGDILRLGLHAVAISRCAGLWTGLKLVADIADASATVAAGVAADEIPDLGDTAARQAPVLLPPSNLDAELALMTDRLELVHEYARRTGLNRIDFEPARPRIGLAAAGLGYASLQRALADLGFDAAALDAAGIRLIRLGMPWPIERDAARDLCADLETVLVIEDKLPFVETQLKEALYRQPHEPLIVGKEDADGRPLLSARSALTADDVADALVTILHPGSIPDVSRRRPGPALPAPVNGDARRTPYFCSGCPHNVSTRATADQLVGVGIGCHAMVVVDTAERRGQRLGMTQMGGEGVQWLGLAPFCAEPHFIQNIGDGTFHHSGSLAIRAAIAAGVNLTYRLLYNDAVAMTGGQTPAGKLPVPALIDELATEGVKRVIVTTPEPERYRGVTLNPIAEVRHRDEFDAAQRELAQIAGVTVLLHDDRCATEKRRLRKRGKLETPPERVWINERVCEGCGDCGEQSSCLSVQPVQTEFGRKTRIQQSSCNQDRTCLKGDCPSFVMVTPKDGDAPRRTAPAPPTDLPLPEVRVGPDVLVRMPGVGGTGVVTVSAILQMAAHLQGGAAAGLEQIGLAQKGGPVVSDLRIADAAIAGQLRATRRSVDVLLGFDLLGAVAADTLAALDDARTIAVLNADVTPTAEMITDPRAAIPESERMVQRVRRATRGDELISLPAETIAETLFGDHMAANMLIVGAAYQHGCLPLHLEAIERAIELNGAAVKTTLAAFAWGRAAVADPAALHAALAAAGPAAARPAAQPPPPQPSAAPDSFNAVVARRVAELTAYQNAAYAAEYEREVQRVAAIERERAGDGSQAVAIAYAEGLYKLMAYKDEYEVARLHLDTIEQAKREAEFGPDAKVQILLHPPVLRSLGMKRKLALGRSARPLFGALHGARGLRGTALDPFGRTELRRLERALVGEYRALVERALGRLNERTRAQVTEIARLPDMVRGYEQIKLDSVERMRERARELQADLETAASRLPEVPALVVTHV